MPYLLLLIVVAVIGFALATHLNKPERPPEQSTATEPNAPPEVPTRPQDVEQFGQDLNKFMQDSATQQMQEIDEMTKNQ